jgi:hypothetical protein
MLKPKSSQSSVCTDKPKKFKQTLSARKLMTAVFWDRRGVMMVEFMHQVTSIMLGVLRNIKEIM